MCDTTSKKKHPCYEELSGRSFKSTLEDIERAVNDFNAHIAAQGEATLNDLYEYLGLEPIGLGNELGWGASDAPVRTHFSGSISRRGAPTIHLGFKSYPRNMRDVLP
jgi:hypothetical protein